MEAANRGAYDAGAKSIGLNITLPKEQMPNPYITPGLCFQFHYFAIRKMHFMLRAKALVAAVLEFGKHFDARRGVGQQPPGGFRNYAHTREDEGAK